MQNKLVPVSGNHSITRVVATVFIPQAFLKPEDVFEKVTDLTKFSLYQKKTTITPTTISINNGSLGIERNEISGFVFEEYDESGRLKNILKLENVKENQSIITIENRVYVNWSDFKSRLFSDIEELSKKIVLYIDAISLTYFDEFKWLGSNKINTNSVFNSKSELLNTKFKDSKNGTLILISQGDTEGKSYEEKTEISFNNNVKRIAMSHQYVIKLKQLALFSTLNDSNSFEEYYEEAHSANKTVLKDVLSKDCQTLINLK